MCCPAGRQADTPVCHPQQLIYARTHPQPETTPSPRRGAGAIMYMYKTGEENTRLISYSPRIRVPRNDSTAHTLAACSQGHYHACRTIQQQGAYFSSRLLESCVHTNGRPKTNLRLETYTGNVNSSWRNTPATHCPLNNRAWHGGTQETLQRQHA